MVVYGCKIHQTKREWTFPDLRDDRVIIYCQIFIVVAQLSITVVVNESGEKEIAIRTAGTGNVRYHIHYIIIIIYRYITCVYIY